MRYEMADTAAISNEKVIKLKSTAKSGLFRPKTINSRASTILYQSTNPSNSQSSNFRTDILIQEQEKNIKELQNLIKTRLETTAIDSSLGANSLTQLKKKLDLALIKYEIVGRLNVELNYARKVLSNAIRFQGDIASARNRVVWLEEKIESIITAENDISFPMQRKLMEDSTLRIKSIKKKLNDEEISEILPENDVTIEAADTNNNSKLSERHKSANVELTTSTPANIDTTETSPVRRSILKINHFNYDIKSEKIESTIKKDDESTGSTDSLLNFSSDEEIEKTDSEYTTKSKKQVNFTKSNTLDSFKKDSTFNDLNESLTIHPKHSGTIKKVTISTVSRDFSDQKSTSTSKTSKYSELKKKKEKKSKLSEMLYWQTPHRSFEWAENVKTLYALDPTTFHQLGLPVRDSYITRDDEVDGKTPWLDKKDTLDFEDVFFVDLAKKIENVYKKVCKTTIESVFPEKKPELIPILVPSEKEPVSRRAQRLIKSYKAPRMSEDTMPKKDEVRLGSTMSHNYVFYPHPITPTSPLPIPKTKKDILYPRTANLYTSLSEKSILNTVQIRRLVNQRNLKEESKLKLFRPRKRVSTDITNDPSIIIYDGQSQDNRSTFESNTYVNTLYSFDEANRWENLKPISSPESHDGLKFEKIRALLSVHLKSDSLDERRDAAKHLGLLNAADNAVTYTLNAILQNEEEPETLKFECAKSLVLLGFWETSVFNYLAKYLKFGNVEVQKDLLKGIINGKNIQYVNQKTEGFNQFRRTLEELTKHRDEIVSLDAAICIGKLGITDSVLAIDKLIDIIENCPDWKEKSLALEVILRQFYIINNETLEYVLNQLQNSPMWPSRRAAVRLLSFLGPSVICTKENIETVYDLLESRLSDDPIKEVRQQIGETMKSLQLFNRVVARMTQNLESHDEDTRAKAVVALDTLGVKRSKIIQMMVDMLELDGSDYVRTLIIKTLSHLAPNDRRVIEVFNKLEKNSHLGEVIKNVRSKTFIY